MLTLLLSIKTLRFIFILFLLKPSSHDIGTACENGGEGLPRTIRLTSVQLNDVPV